MSQEFNNRFKRLKAEKTGELYEEKQESPSTPTQPPSEPTIVHVPPKKSYTTLVLLFLSLTLNGFFVYTVKESLAMYASPEHTLYKHRVSPNESFIDEAMYKRAVRRVCEN